MKRVILPAIAGLFGIIAISTACSGRTSDTTPEATLPTVAPTEETVAKPLSFAFVGDIMMGTTYPETPRGAYLPDNDGRDLFQAVKPIFDSVDVVAGNLEGTLLDNGGEVKRCGDPSLCYAFRMPTRYVNHLKDAGFDFVGIANNHINDFGPTGLRSTMTTLNNAGLAYAGLREECPTAIIERDGKRIGFAAFGHSKGNSSIMDLENVKRTVSSLKDTCDIVVVSFHGGGEGPRFTHVTGRMEECFGEQRGNVAAFAHAAVDAGADVVYGHGPHVTRGLELYKDHLIIYSLGNFCTPYRVNLNGISGHAPVVTVELNEDGTFNKGRIHSFIQQKGRGPVADESNSVAANMRRLSREDFPSSPLKISAEGELTY